MDRKCENRTAYFRYFMAGNCELNPGVWEVYLRKELRMHRRDSRLTSWASLVPSCWGPSDKTCGRAGSTEPGISTALATETASHDLSPFVYIVTAPSVEWPASVGRSSSQHTVVTVSAEALLVGKLILYPEIASVPVRMSRFPLQKRMDLV